MWRPSCFTVKECTPEATLCSLIWGIFWGSAICVLESVSRDGDFERIEILVETGYREEEVVLRD